MSGITSRLTSLFVGLGIAGTGAIALVNNKTFLQNWGEDGTISPDDQRPRYGSAQDVEKIERLIKRKQIEEAQKFAKGLHFLTFAPAPDSNVKVSSQTLYEIRKHYAGEWFHKLPQIPYDYSTDSKDLEKVYAPMCHRITVLRDIPTYPDPRIYEVKVCQLFVPGIVNAAVPFDDQIDPRVPKGINLKFQSTMEYVKPGMTIVKASLVIDPDTQIKWDSDCENFSIGNRVQVDELIIPKSIDQLKELGVNIKEYLVKNLTNFSNTKHFTTEFFVDVLTNHEKIFNNPRENDGTVQILVTSLLNVHLGKTEQQVIEQVHDCVFSKNNDFIKDVKKSFEKQLEGRGMGPLNLDEKYPHLRS